MNNIIGSARIINYSRLQGWFLDKNDLDKPLTFELYINNLKVKEIISDNFREDLLEKKIHPTGKIGFSFDVAIDKLDDIRLKFLNLNYEYIVQKGIDTNLTIRKRKLCVVHIGIHKTGTSSIQHHLANKKYETFSYFDLGSENHSIPIYSFFSKEPEKYHIHWRAGRTKEEVVKYNNKVEKLFKKHLIDNEKEETFVISGEDISVLPYESVKSFKLFLLEYFENIKIFAYVRSPGSFISSDFQEHVKAGLGSFNIEIHYPNYRRRIEKFDILFGKNNVHLLHFDPKIMFNNDVTCDFLKQLNINSSEKIDMTNESLSLEATALIYTFNKFSAVKYEAVIRERMRIKIIEILKKIGNQKFILSNRIIQNVLNENIDDLQWIEDRMQIDFSNENLNNLNGVESEKSLENIAKIAYENLNIAQKNSLNYIIEFDEFINCIS